MRAHTKERHFSGTVCEKSFSCSKNLKLYKKTHIEELIYDSGGVNLFCMF